MKAHAPSPRTRLALAAALLLAAGLAGCVGPAAPPGGAPEPVGVVLKWFHQAQFAGLYVAERQGLYGGAGLRVALIEGDPDRDPADRVAAGEAQFGITSVPQFLLARERGLDVVAIAAIYQKSPVGFFALAERGIDAPEDLVGKRIAMKPTHEAFLRAMFHRLGLDYGSVTPVPHGADLGPWYRGEADVWAGYVMNQPVDARLAGKAVTIVFPDDYGVHMHDDVVFATRAVLRDRPDLAERFLGATVEGWRRALQDPEAAVQATLAAKPSLRDVKERAFLLASAPLIQTGDRPIGWIEPGRWESGHRVLLEQGIVLRDPSADLGGVDRATLRALYPGAGG